MLPITHGAGIKADLVLPADLHEGSRGSARGGRCCSGVDSLLAPDYQNPIQHTGSELLYLHAWRRAEVCFRHSSAQSRESTGRIASCLATLRSHSTMLGSMWLVGRCPWPKPGAYGCSRMSICPRLVPPQDPALEWILQLKNQ